VLFALVGVDSAAEVKENEHNRGYKEENHGESSKEREGQWSEVVAYEEELSVDVGKEAWTWSPREWR